MEQHNMHSIWYFVGLVLLSMGGLVLIAGILEWISPTDSGKVLANTHPGVWWGALMVIVGAIFFWKNRGSGSAVH